MKKISYLAYLVLLYANSLLAQTVTINDLGLSQGLKENLGLTETQNLTVSQLNSLKELDLTGYGILDMAGLQNCTNLEYLKISSNQISNLSAISNLSKLKYLDLSSNTLTSINTLTVLRDCIVFIDNNYMVNTPNIHSSNTINGLTNQRNDDKLGNFNFTIRPQIIDANLRKVRIYYRSGSDLNNNALMNVGDQRRNNDPYDFGFYNCISDGQTRYIDHTYNDYGTFTVFLYFLINGTQSTKISCSFNLTQPPPVIPVTVINIETPTSVSMGSVNVGGSFDKIITIKNASTSNAELTGTIAPINGVDMSIISGSQTLILAPNQSQDITVRFRPLSGGVYNNSLSISGNFNGTSKSISLTGTGVTVLPTLTYSRATGQTYSLLDAQMGNFSDAIISVSNYSSTAFSGSFAVTGNGYSGFIIGGSGSNLIIPAGGSQNITVRFTPTANGVSTGSLNITGSATNTPATFNFSTLGTGFPTSGCVTSSTINITSNVNISTSGWREFGRFTLTNTSNSLPANISNFQAGPSENFRISGYQQNAQFSLNPNESREFVVEISPISTQAYYSGIISLNTPIQSCNSLRIQLKGTPAVSALNPPPLVEPAVDFVRPYTGFESGINLGIRLGNMFGVARYKYFLTDMTTNQMIFDNYDGGIAVSGNAETLRGFNTNAGGDRLYKLIAGHRYSWKVRAESVSDPNIYADSELRYFSVQQPSTCYPPSDFSVTNITKNSALVTWNPIPTIYQNPPRYRVLTSIDNGITYNSVSDDPGTSFLINGLLNSQNYKIKIQTVCIGGVPVTEFSRSQLSTDKSFTTLADCSTLTSSITPNITQTICQGSSVNLTSSVGSSYKWYKDDVLITGATNQIYLAGQAGNYKVKVTYSNGCEVFSNAVSISEITKPNVLISSNYTGICPNASVNLSTSQISGTTYQWVKDGVNIPNTNSNSYSATSPGIYKLAYTQNGCTFTTDLLNLPLLPAPSIYISGNNDLTVGNTLNLSAFGANTYYWSGSNFSSTVTQITIPNIQTTNAGNYSVVGTGTNGCTSSVNFTVTVSPATCTLMYTLKSGNWNDATVWSCGRIPTSQDNITIKATHNVYLNSTQSGYCKNITTELNSVLNIPQGAKMYMNTN
jgi:hypothetical protein